MKKMFKYLPIVLGFVMFTTSCADDDGTEPAEPTPTLSISVNGNANLDTYDVTVGEQIIVVLNGQKADRDLDELKVVQNGTNAITTGVGFTFNSTTEVYDLENNIAVSLKNDDDETLLLRDTLTTITSIIGETTYTFTLTDKDGLSTTTSFKINVESADILFTSTETGVYYHVGGSLAGRWNVSADDATTMTGTVLENTDVAGLAFTGAFEVRGMGEGIVEADNNFDYAAANATNTEAAYISGTATTSVTAPAVDDVYLIKMASGAYVAMKVTAVDPSDNTCSCGNTGKLTFEYKK